MEIIGLQDAIKARQEKNTFTVFEITTTPGLLERIEYLISPGDWIIDKLVFTGLRNIGIFNIPSWDVYYKDNKLNLLVTDSSHFKVQWKHACDPSLANLKYTLGA